MGDRDSLSQQFIFVDIKPSAMPNGETVFDKVRNHEGREILDEKLKFIWRFRTLSNDYKDLREISEADVPHATERAQQLETQGYVFEVERRLHHYLSGLYTLHQQQLTLQNGVGKSFRQDLQDVKDEYLSKKISRTVIGLRHYVQHENTLPLQARVSRLEDSASLVIMVDDLHRKDADRDFEQHFGHIEKPYLDPVEWILNDWPNVERFFKNTLEVMEEQTQEEMEELHTFREEIDELYEEVADKYRRLD
ncbi:hypothetical protein [Natrinema sp. 1APR25-10V2]|uniref:hypothetical protein n=1 Tax=Natrinema sp. 1APR25-10V2 TaxID=2951081 RepID=UPI0028740DCD|nr:hypothetical protein [Natrinema sp. 1APR25-10V2]MDS0474591.1 hypothetical protein [Natrinema sp. 1APR25-10V2]